MNTAKLVFGVVCALAGTSLLAIGLSNVYGITTSHPFGWQKDEQLMVEIGAGLLFVSLVALGTRKPALRGMAIAYAAVFGVEVVAFIVLKVISRLKHGGF